MVDEGTLLWEPSAERREKAEREWSAPGPQA